MRYIKTKQHICFKKWRFVLNDLLVYSLCVLIVWSFESRKMCLYIENFAVNGECWTITINQWKEINPDNSTYIIYHNEIWSICRQELFLFYLRYKWVCFRPLSTWRSLSRSTWIIHLQLPRWMDWTVLRSWYVKHGCFIFLNYKHGFEFDHEL